MKKDLLPLGDGGFMTVERWKRNGADHRLGAPAVTTTDADGVIRSERYYRAGRSHRIDGPDVVTYGPDGMVTSSPAYAIRGAEFDTHAAAIFHLVAISERGEPEFTEEIENSDYRVFLDEGHTPEELYDVFAESIASIEGVREVFGGAPAEWVRSWESGEGR